MNKTIGRFIAGLLFSVGFLGIPTSVSAQVSFGGYITFFNPICETPPGAFMTTTAIPLMYVPGTISFLAGPPRGTGQALLGIFGGYLPCIIWPGPTPVKIGGGPYIILHGSS